MPTAGSEGANPAVSACHFLQQCQRVLTVLLQTSALPGQACHSLSMQFLLDCSTNSRVTLAGVLSQWSQLQAPPRPVALGSRKVLCQL